MDLERIILKQPVPASANTVSYGQANVADQYTSVTGRAPLTYDGRGNLTGHNDRSYAFDFRNRLVSALAGNNAIVYDYDTTGRRKAKTVNGQTTEFLHAGDMEIAEYDGSTLLRRYIPGGTIDVRVAYIEESGGATDIFYYHADRLGNVAALTNSEGRVTDRYAYDPFGNEMAGASSSGNPFRYTGRRFDDETGLYFYRARYYDAGLGRFLSTDPIGYEDQYNLYTYVANDPLNLTDPDGRDGCHVTLGCARELKAAGRKDLADAAVGGIPTPSAGEAAVLGVMSLAVPGPEDVAIGVAAATKIGQGIAKVADDIAGAIGSAVRGGDDIPASTPTGQRGSPLDVTPGTNPPGTVNGREFSGHAFDQMQGRGVPPSAVENAIQTGTRTPGNRPNTNTFTDNTNGVTAVTNDNGRVITVITREIKAQ